MDSENNVDVSVYQGDVQQKSCGTLQLTYGLEQSDQIYHIYCSARGDILKFSKSAGNIVVFEVAVTGAGTVFDNSCQMLAQFVATLTTIFTTQIRDIIGITHRFNFLQSYLKINKLINIALQFANKR